MNLTTERKKEIFAKFGGKETNTGSSEAQVAMFTERINHISGHLKTNRKDHAGTRALMKLVGKRRRLLQYIAKKDILKYREIIEQLGLRK